MKKPVIGVTPSHEPDSSEINVRFSYLDAVAAGGGIPLVFPLKLEQEDILRLASLCDGFLLPAGRMYTPSALGRTPMKNAVMYLFTGIPSNWRC